MEVEKNLVEYLLPHLLQLLEQLGFKGGGPFSPTSAGIMKGSVKVNVQGEPAVHNPRHCLPQELNGTNAAEITTDIGNEHGGLPCASYCKVALPEIRVN